MYSIVFHFILQIPMPTKDGSNRLGIYLQTSATSEPQVYMIDPVPKSKNTKNIKQANKHNQANNRKRKHIDAQQKQASNNNKTGHACHHPLRQQPEGGQPQHAHFVVQPRSDS